MQQLGICTRKARIGLCVRSLWLGLYNRLHSHNVNPDDIHIHVMGKGGLKDVQARAH